MTYSFSQELVGRTAKNLNALIATVGSPGSGKSYFALATAEAIVRRNNVPFGIENVCFSLEEFNERINSNLPKGSILILDEAAVMANSRTWYSLANRLMNYILITFRSSNLIVFLCMPSIDMIDSQARKLLHYVVEPVSINRTTNVSTCKLMRYELNPTLAKTYNKYPWIESEEGNMAQVRRIKCPLPSLALRKAYEEKKAVFREELGRNIAMELQASKVKSEHSKPAAFTDNIEYVVEHISDFQTKYNNRVFVDVQLIRNHFQVGEPNARKIKRAVESELKKRISNTNTQ